MKKQKYHHLQEQSRYSQFLQSAAHQRETEKEAIHRVERKRIATMNIWEKDSQESVDGVLVEMVIVTGKHILARLSEICLYQKGNTL